MSSHDIVGEPVGVPVVGAWDGACVVGAVGAVGCCVGARVGACEGAVVVGTPVGIEAKTKG